MKQTCYQYLRSAFTALPDGPAVRCGGEVLTRSDFLRQADALAARLAGLGVAAGDAVTVILPTSAEAFLAFYAINRLGAAANLIHPLSAAPLLAKTLRQTQAKAVFAAADLSEQLIDVLAACGLPCILCGQAPLPALPQAIPFAACAEAGGVPGAPAADPDAPAVLLHGGGTTGESRSILLSSANLNAIARMLEGLDDPARPAGEAALTVLPLFHAFGLAVAMHYPLTHGYCCVPLPRFSGEAAAALMRQIPIAFLVGVPAMFQKLLETPGFAGPQLRSLRLAFCGGDTLPPRLAQAFDAAVLAAGGAARLRGGYGLTEAGSVCTVAEPGVTDPQLVGRPLPGVTVEICDAGGQPLPPGATGEITVSGESVMLGYYSGDLRARNDGVSIDQDGRRRIRTGDLGRLEADGTLRFVGRKKRVLLRSGYTIHPAEIEAAALALPCTAEACAVQKQGQIRLYVTLRAPAPQAAAQILAHCRAQLARYAWPQSVEVLPAMPRTPLGKVDYQALSDTTDL